MRKFWKRSRRTKRLLFKEIGEYYKIKPWTVRRWLKDYDLRTPEGVILSIRRLEDRLGINR